MPKYGVISGSNTEKYGPEITPHLQTFHAVIINAVLGLSRNIPLLKLLHYLDWLLMYLVNIFANTVVSFGGIKSILVGFFLSVLLSIFLRSCSTPVEVVGR